MELTLKNKKILIVEDEAAMLRILVDSFEKEGCIVLKAKDGEEGLQKALNEFPDLIILDILLPKIDGLSILKRLRETSEYSKKVPVILLTNLSPDKEEINKAVTETYPAYYLVKSNWNVEDVVDKVKERLSRE